MSFIYLCTNLTCCNSKGVLSDGEVTEDRKCAYCGMPTSDFRLYDASPFCKHKQKENLSGLTCIKCGGWFCF